MYIRCRIENQNEYSTVCDQELKRQDFAKWDKNTIK